MSTQHKTRTERACTAIRLECASHVMEDTCRTLKAQGFSIASVRPNSIVLRDVPESDIGKLTEASMLHDFRIAGLFGEKVLMHPEKVIHKKPLRLAVYKGDWLFSELTENTHPFVHVVQVSQGKSASGGEVQVFELNFHDHAGTMPDTRTLIGPELVKLELRPATVEDYERLDMIPPSDLSDPNQGYKAPEGQGIPDPTMVPQSGNAPLPQASPLDMRHWQ